MRDFLCGLLNNSAHVIFATAYIGKSGLILLQDEINNFIQKRNKLERYIGKRKYPEETEIIESEDHSMIKSLEIPLFSLRTNEVALNSGLNWWNGGGRTRDSNEVYIPLPIEIIKKNPEFFPNKAYEGTEFSAIMDDNSYMKMRIEQGGPIDLQTNKRFGKAISSAPSKRLLGKWILRDKLKLAPGTLVNRKILRKYGRETIEFQKITNEIFYVNFIP